VSRRAWSSTLATIATLLTLSRFGHANSNVHCRGRVADGGTHHGLRAVVRLQSLTRPFQLVQETSGDGRFDFDVSADRYTLEAGVGGYEENQREVALGAADVELEIALRRRPYESVVTAQPRNGPREGTSSFTLWRRNLEAIPAGVDRALPEVLRVAPGVTADAFGQNHVRGNYADIRYWLDGVPLPASLSNQILTLIPTEAISKVELVTGGMPAEFDGVAGAALVETAPPAAGHAAYLKLSYGTYDTVRPAAGFAGTWGKWSVMLAGSYEMTSRGLDSPTATPVVHDHSQGGQVLARLGYAIRPQDRLDLHVMFRQASMEIPIDTTLQPLSAAPPHAQRGTDAFGNDPPRFVPFDANPTQFERDLFASLAWRHHFEKRGDLLASAIYRSGQGDLRCDPARALGASADPGTVCSDVSHTAASYGGLLHYSVGLGELHTLKAGVQVSEQENNVRYTQYGRDDQKTLGGVAGGATHTGEDLTHVVTMGAFVQNRFAWRKLALIAGFRFDLQSVTLPDGRTLLADTPSGRLGASWQLNRIVGLHAFVGYLWLAPSLDAPTAGRALGLVPADQQIAYDMKPEETWSAEIGVEVRPLPSLIAHATLWGRLSTHPIDDQEVGNTDLKAEYNYDRGRGYGMEVGAQAALFDLVSAFGNLSLQQAQGQGIASGRYLFTAEQLAYTGWQSFDHQQLVTANLGLDVQDRSARAHLDVWLQYGSGLRTGPTNDLTLPAHATLDVSLRYRFDLWGQPEVACDVLNLLNDAYAYRIGNASVVGSAYAPLRRFLLRLTWHL